MEIEDTKKVDSRIDNQSSLNATNAADGEISKIVPQNTDLNEDQSAEKSQDTVEVETWSSLLFTTYIRALEYLDLITCILLARYCHAIAMNNMMGTYFLSGKIVTIVLYISTLTPYMITYSGLIRAAFIHNRYLPGRDG